MEAVKAFSPPMSVLPLLDVALFVKVPEGKHVEVADAIGGRLWTAVIYHPLVLCTGSILQP